MFIERVKHLVFYDTERDFYAKVFPESVEKKEILRIRPMRLSDLPAVLAIERQVYNYPWSEGIFKDCFTAGYSCWVCEDLEKVIAFSILSIAAGEAHIMNICVDPAEQGQGIGRKMIRHLIKIARYGKAESIFLEVRPSNHSAKVLYQKMGFNEIGIRKAYYPAENGREDALMLALELL